MKKICALGFLAVLIITSCSKDPSASFSYAINGTTVTFTNTSSDASSYEWDFDDGYVSYEKNPIHTFSFSGTYYVTMRAIGDKDKSDLASATIIINETDLTIYNPLPTATDIWINGTYVVTLSDYSFWTIYNIDGNSVDIYAETWGETNAYDQIGDLLYWDFTEDLYGGSQDLTLTINSNFFFLFMENDGTADLNPVYVNCSNVSGNPSGTYTYYEDIVIPNDGYEYNTGWFSATDAYLNIAAWRYGTSYWTYWEYPTVYWDNDYYRWVSVLNTYKKTTSTELNSTTSVSEHPKLLKQTPSLKSGKLNISKNAIKKVSNGSKKERRSK